MKSQFQFLSISAVTLLVGCSPSGQKGGPANIESDPTIVSKLQEIVELRQRNVEEEQILLKLGTGKNSAAAAVSLAEARINLASAQGQTDLVIAELRNIVKIQRERFERGKSLAEENRETQAKLSNMKVALLEAEIRLQRELSHKEE